MVNIENCEEIFTEIYKRNIWGSTESASGSGSQLTQTSHLRSEIPVLLNELNIRSLLDVPCGDFNWMQHVDLGEINYIGGDIVLELVQRNRDCYANPFRKFEHVNLISSPLPRADAILCRDCLVHLPHTSIFSALDNMCSSGALYLMTTHFSYRTMSANEEISSGWQWRRLNFELAPFHWPPPQRYIIEGCDEQGGRYADKSLSVWPINQIRSRLRRSG